MGKESREWDWEGGLGPTDTSRGTSTGLPGYVSPETGNESGQENAPGKGETEYLRKTRKSCDRERYRRYCLMIFGPPNFVVFTQGRVKTSSP